MMRNVKLHYYEKLFSDIPGAIVLASSSGRVLGVNEEFSRMFGYTMEEALGRCIEVVDRAGDLVARYGGEEFVAVLSGTGVEDARRIAEKMRQRVKDLGLPHDHSKVANHVTVSLGVAVQVPIPHGDPMEGVLKADQALYQAKAKGRDRVETDEA